MNKKVCSTTDPYLIIMYILLSMFVLKVKGSLCLININHICTHAQPKSELFQDAFRPTISGHNKSYFPPILEKFYLSNKSSWNYLFVVEDHV